MSEPTPPPNTAPPVLRCRDCPKNVADTEEALKVSWTYLQITGRWQCPECWRALRAASGIVGTPGIPGVDTLPKNSIGALDDKVTAKSILPVAVKG